jgi:hypothetical protein
VSPTNAQRRSRAELTAAWTTGFGVGLIGLMVTWLVMNRVTSLFMDAPEGPVLAFGTAVGVGFFVTAIVGKHLTNTVKAEAASMIADRQF